MLAALLFACSEPAPADSGAPPADTGEAPVACLDPAPIYAACEAKSLSSDPVSSTIRSAEQTWDADGNLVRHTLDNDADGTDDVLWTWTWGADGMLTATQDLGGDGTIELDTTYTYAGGLLVEVLVDAIVEGADSATRYGHDAEGRVVLVELDLGADGTVEQTTTQAWDGERVAAEETDEDGDGEPDVTCAWAYASDDQGREVATRTCEGEDGELRLVAETITDTNGNLVSSEEDRGGDGTTDLRLSWTLDERCLVTRTSHFETDPVSGNALFREELTTFDEIGRAVLVDSINSVTVDGEVVETATSTTTSYTCP